MDLFRIRYLIISWNGYDEKWEQEPEQQEVFVYANSIDEALSKCFIPLIRSNTTFSCISIERLDVIE